MPTTISSKICWEPYENLYPLENRGQQLVTFKKKCSSIISPKVRGFGLRTLNNNYNGKVTNRADLRMIHRKENNNQLIKPTGLQHQAQYQSMHTAI